MRKKVAEKKVIFLSQMMMGEGWVESKWTVMKVSSLVPLPMLIYRFAQMKLSLGFLLQKQ